MYNCLNLYVYYNNHVNLHFAFSCYFFFFTYLDDERKEWILVVVCGKEEKKKKKKVDSYTKIN